MKTQTVQQDSNHSSAMRQVVTADDFKLYFDVPEALGGESSAPNPHVYLDAAVLACKAITIRLFAARRGYDLQDVNITLNTDDSKEREGQYVMNFDIELLGDLDEKAKKSLLAAAEQCPIGKLLGDKVNVTMNSRLV